MKRRTVLVLAVVCALFVLSPVLGIADDQTPQNAISIDLAGTALNLVFGDIPFFFVYQRVLTDHFVLAVLPSFWIAPNGTFDFRPWVELDWHPFNLGLKGFFVGLAVEGGVENNSTPVTNNYFLGVAPAIGYQLLLASNFDLDFAVGVAFDTAKTNFNGGSFGIDFAQSRTEIGLGYRF